MLNYGNLLLDTTWKLGKFLVGHNLEIREISCRTQLEITEVSCTTHLGKTQMPSSTAVHSTLNSHLF